MSHMPEISEPTVSTIIPTFAGAATVARAVASALDQTYPRQELIVVDDGSPDGAAIAAALAPFGDRLRLLRKPNGGVASARNLGMAHARGSLFAFLDDDDTWMPDKLERQIAFLAERPHCGLCGTEYIRIDVAGREVHRSALRAHYPDDRPNIAQALSFPSVPPSTMLVRKAAVDEVGGFDTGLRTAEDVDFQLRIAQRWGIGIVDQPLLRYRMGHEDGLSYGRGTYWDHQEVIRKHLRRHAATLGPELTRQLLLKNLFRNGRGLASGGWLLDGLRFAAASGLHTRDLPDAVALGKLGALMLRSGAGKLARTVAGRWSLVLRAPG
jgi:glycosyltransferase involved in cell wall biosynthesis